MVATSTMTPLGTVAPDFALFEPRTGRVISRGDFGGDKALLVMFICNHCPYVRHVRHGLADLGRVYESSPIGIVAISSNDASSYPEDGPEGIAEEAASMDYRFPYLYDESQEVAKAYGAVCTPDFFLFGPDRTLVYRGRMDGARPNMPGRVTGEELRAAIDAVLADGPVPTEQLPSMGCSIKWKPGNEPDYA